MNLCAHFISASQFQDEVTLAFNEVHLSDDVWGIVVINLDT